MIASALWLSMTLTALRTSISVSARALQDLKPEESSHLVAREDKLQFSVDANLKYIPAFTDGNVGDNLTETFDITTPCEQGTSKTSKRAFRLPIHCSAPPPDRSCYTAPDRTVQRPLRQLTPAQQDQIWHYAKTQGAALGDEMTVAARRKISRLSPMQRTKQDLTAKIMYSTPELGVQPVKISDNIKGIAEAFKDALCSVDGDEEFDYLELFPKQSVFKDPRTGQVPSILELGASGPASVIISTKSDAAADSNYPNEKVYSSALTWNAWRQIASDTDYRALKYHMRAWVVNQETLNIMNLAHEKFAKTHVSLEGYPPHTMYEAGQGTWIPGDEAFDALLATENVKVSVNMILDHSDEMDNPYITEIHTFGGYFKQPGPGEEWNDDTSYVRPDMIIIKYGPAPADTSNVAETIQTA